MRSSSIADGKIEDIQALRGISILLVFFQHLSLTATVFSKFPHKIELPFHLGVEMFFVISGYVVTLALFKDDFRGIRFLIKRFFRLVPVLVFFLAISYGLVLWVRQMVPPEFVAYSYFAPTDSQFLWQAASILGGFYSILREPVPIYANAAIWSLSVEDQFYATVAVICIFGLAMKRVTRIPARWWVFIAASTFFVVACYMRVRVLRGKEATRIWPATLEYLLFYRFDFLALGMLLAFADRSLPARSRIWLREKGPFAAGYLLLLPIGLVALCESPVAPHPRLLVGLGMPCTLIGFGGLVLLAGNQCAFPGSKGGIYRGLVWVGNRSYTYYVLHYPVFLAAWLIMYRWRPSSFATAWSYGFAQIAIALPILAVLVEFVFRYVEMPLTRLGKRLVEGRKSRSSEMTTRKAADAAPESNSMLEAA